MMKWGLFGCGLCWFVLVFSLFVWNPLCLAATYYVRTDGGTAAQCNGLSNAAYTGTGNQCAWSHPFWALDASGNWKIAGGDTIIISPGSYRMGYGAPNTGWCDSAYPYDCHLPPLPSGPNTAQPTRILGSGWNQGCSTPPELWGTERPWQILSLDGTSNAVVSCLEITDHSSCIEDYQGDPSMNCQRNTPPFGDWASGGIYAANSSDVTLSHLNIHGLAHYGVHAGLLSNWTVENVRIAGNGWVGWDGDTDLTEGGSACTGNMIFRNFTVEWNGCGERYPEETPCGCWGQTAGGFGDGMGLGRTGGDWLFEDSIFRYNTSDGLDLLYVRDNPSNIEIKRTQAYGNAGNQIKTNGPTHIENTLLVGNCGFFDGKTFTYHVDNCRAGGQTLSLDFRKGNQNSVNNSTIVGHGDTLCLAYRNEDCDGSETLIAQNNVFMGYTEFLDPEDRSSYIWFEPEVSGTVNTDYNVVFNAKIGNVALAAHDLDQDPQVVDSNLETFDGHLQAGSPAIDSGLAVGSLSGLVPDHDLENNSRPWGAGVDRGAYERTITCPPCSGPRVENVKFENGCNCTCTNAASLTIGANVVIETGATVSFQAPVVTVEPGFHAPSGSKVSIKQPSS